jgi:trimeric autotransporter adhesin
VLHFLFKLFKQIARPTNKMALVFATISCAFSQPAVIRGVENAASGSSYAVVPQMLVSIYGSNFASQTVIASGSPLPTQLGGASVTFNGIAAPLLYVSSGQINAQVPSGLQGSSSANVVVQTPLGASAAFPVTVTPTGIRDAAPLITSFGSAPGIFTQDSSGCGQAAALNIHADGSTTPNTPQTSFDPQKDSGFAIFLTGLGYFPDRADGVPWSYNAADNRSIELA